MSMSVNALQNPTGPIITVVEREQSLFLVDFVFEAEISVKTIVGGDASLLGAFFGASIRAGVQGGEIFVATEAADSSMIRGMALWWGPGIEPFSTFPVKTNVENCMLSYPNYRQRHKSGTAQSRVDLSLGISHPLTFRIQYRPDFANLTETLLGPQGKLDSWYLNLLAVDPEHQRLGVARALIDAVRRKASTLYFNSTESI
ncbi:hypothetical protein B0H19DRAFT_1342183 [Mycena capillaripes]|nr:hypothetical protein B0H19DRAFT_1342183 [Mycena capillaripes]